MNTSISFVESLPPQFKNTILNTYPQSGPKWLRELESQLIHYQEKWRFMILRRLEPLTYHYAALVKRENGKTAVLKAGIPDDPENLSEMAALQHFDGNGTVTIFEMDMVKSIFLMEHLSPGKNLTDLEDEEATEIAAGLMKQILKAPEADHQFRSLQDWGKGFSRLREQFEGKTGPFNEQTIQRAEDVFNSWQPSKETDVILHGDLHHWNVLSAERAPWLIIDPKGIIGPPVCETSTWLRNPYPALFDDPDCMKITERRIDQFSEILGYDKNEIKQWGFAMNVLSSIWSFESNDPNWVKTAAFSEFLSPL